MSNNKRGSTQDKPTVQALPSEDSRKGKSHYQPFCRIRQQYAFNKIKTQSPFQEPTKEAQQKQDNKSILGTTAYTEPSIALHIAEQKSTKQKMKTQLSKPTRPQSIYDRIRTINTGSGYQKIRPLLLKANQIVSLHTKDRLMSNNNDTFNCNSQTNSGIGSQLEQIFQLRRRNIKGGNQRPDQIETFEQRVFRELQQSRDTDQTKENDLTSKMGVASRRLHTQAEANISIKHRGSNRFPSLRKSVARGSGFLTHPDESQARLSQFLLARTKLFDALQDTNQSIKQLHIGESQRASFSNSSETKHRLSCSPNVIPLLSNKMRDLLREIDEYRSDNSKFVGETRKKIDSLKKKQNLEYMESTVGELRQMDHIKINYLYMKYRKNMNHDKLLKLNTL